jgi:hypothetical protein
MANLYWRSEKAPKETAIELLMTEVVECTDNRFYVRHGSDGTGGHLCIYVETIHTKDASKFKWKVEPPHKFQGWRVIRIMVPIGYIDGILLAREKDDA